MSATISVELGLDGKLIATLPSGRPITLGITEAGFVLLRALRADRSDRAAPAPTPAPILPTSAKVRKFDKRGQRKITLAELGLTK